MYREQFGEFACGYWGLKGYCMNQDCLHAQWFFFFKDVTDTAVELILVKIESESDVSIVQNYCAVNKVKKLVVFQLFSFEKLTHW